MTETPWGNGDLFSIAIGILVLIAGITIKQRRITIPLMISLLGTGISLGPLLLIICDPFSQYFGFHVKFLEIVLNEGRATLWWASAIAAIYLIRGIF